MASHFAQEPAAGLLRRASAGDDAAFTELYRTYSRPVYTLAMRMLNHREAAEDVLQEVFMEMMRSLPGYRAEGPFWGWLRRLAVNKVLMRIRAEQARPAAGPLDDAPWHERLQSADRSGRVLLAHDLEGALAELSPMSRVVVWLHDVEGWTHREIGAAMGRTPSFSKSQLARAHVTLRGLLEEDGYASGD